jgi:hypothetical protein
MTIIRKTILFWFAIFRMNFTGNDGSCDFFFFLYTQSFTQREIKGPNQHSQYQLRSHNDMGEGGEPELSFNIKYISGTVNFTAKL